MRRNVHKKRLALESLEQRHLLSAEGLISHWPLDLVTLSHFRDAGPARNDVVTSGSVNHEDTDRGRALVTSNFPPEQADFNVDVTDAVTISAWFKAIDVDQGGFVFAISPAGMQLQPIGNKLKFSMQTLDNGQISHHLAEGTFQFENNTWYHIAGTYNGERMIAFVNGDDVGSAEVTGDIKIDGKLIIGSGWIGNDPVKEFRGSLDEIQLYGRALTPAQIEHLSQQPAVLETSDEPSFLNAEHDPVFVDPHIEISSHRDHFENGLLAAVMNETDSEAGDAFGIANTEAIQVDGDNVFFRKEGTSHKIGELQVASNLRLNVSHLTEAATPEAVQALARAITFTTTSDETHDRRVRIDLATHQVSPPFADTRLIRFGVPSTQSLALETSEGASQFDPAGDAIIVDPHVEVVSGSDHLNGGRLTARFIEESGRESDQLLIRDTESIQRTGELVRFIRPGAESQVIGNVSGGENGAPLIVELNENSGADAVEALARAISFDNTAGDTPGHPRLVRFILTDGSGGEAADIKRVEIADEPAPQNQPPNIEIPDGTTVFAEGSEPVAVLPSVGISDPDSPNFGGGSLRVTFAEQSAREGDRLLVRSTERILIDEGNVFDRSVDPPLRIGEVDVPEADRVVVFHFNEHVNHDLAELITRTVHFGNPAAEPMPGLRLIRFELNDGDGGSDHDVRRLEIESENDPPIIEFSEGVTLFTEGDPPVIIDAHVEIDDPDSANFGGGKLIADFAEQTRRDGDRLDIRGSEHLVVDGNHLRLVVENQTVDIAVFGHAEGALVIEFNEDADSAAVQIVARHITFGNDLQAISNDDRLVRFTVKDGDGGTAHDLRRIEAAATNDAPVIEFSAGATVFTEGSEPVNLDPRVEVGDPDSPNFDGGRLIAGFAEQTRREGDRLGIRGSEHLVIQGNDLLLVHDDQTVKVADFGFNEGALVIEFNEAADANAVQIVARHITYGNDSDELNSDDRLVRFTVHDGDGGSGHDIRRIEIEHVNRPPLVHFAEGATAFVGETVRVDLHVEVGDPDSENFDEGTLVVFFVEESRRDGDFVGLVPSEGLLIEESDIKIPREGQAVTVADFRFAEGRLVISFNAEANAEIVQRVARHVVFGNERDEVPAGNRFIKFVVNDGDGGEGFDVKRIVVEHSNADPVVHVADSATIFEVGEGPVIIAPRIEIGDADSPDFSGGSLTVRMIENTGAEGDAFGIHTGEGIEVDGHHVTVISEGEPVLIGEIREASDGISLIIDLNEHATPALTQRLARRITFDSTVAEIGERDVRLVQLKVGDGDGGFGSDVKRIELIVQPDDDLDGVDDDVEDDAPNDGDGNQDGVPDSEQRHVASIRGDGDHFVTIVSPEETRLVDVRAMENPSPDDNPADIEFPVGFFDFNVEGVQSDVSTVVTIKLQPGTSANSYYVFGPTPDDPNPHWYPFLFDGQTGAKIFGDRIEVHYMDGQRGDSDLSSNGIIADPGAPALTQVPWQNPASKGDVNFDGKVSALDALVILNDLRIYSPRSLPLLASGGEQLASLFLDVSGDNSATALDALRVINLLAQNALNATAESERVGAVVGPATIQSSSDNDDDQRIWDEAIMGIADSLY